MADKFLERSPDKQPSHSGMDISDRGDSVVWLLKVRGLGVLMLRGDHTKDWHGVSIFTDEQLQFD